MNYIPGWNATSPQFHGHTRRNYRRKICEIDWEPMPLSDQPAVLAMLQALQAADVMPRTSYLYTMPVGANHSNPQFNEMTDPFWGEVASYLDRMSGMTYTPITIMCGQGWERPTRQI